jgi:hypothetical protein
MSGFNSNIAGFFNGLFTGNVEITDNTKGVILKSPDNTRWLISVSNLGVLSAAVAP